MDLKDNINLNGHFKLIAIDSKGNETIYEEKNLIMDKARVNMAELISGSGRGLPVTKLILGTQGHNPDTSNILEPIQVGTFGFESSRESLYSVENEEFYYTIKWDPNNPVGPDLETNSDGEDGIVTWTETGALSAYGIGNKIDQDGTEQDAENAPCPIEIVVLDRTVRFTITIPEIAANGPTGDGVVGFTEASLMSGDDIFSMKTFSARVKENTVKYVIVWSILL
ncbi:MAG: hypothetical protein U9R03_04435 [Candidatus Aerophobetes bacterium]|nr:hypothetical protein [Candidatus Aerophobetes bacterium]